MSRITLFGLPFENVTLAGATAQIIDAARPGAAGGIVVTPNVDHVVSLHRDPEMRSIFERAAFRYADGMPLVWLSRLVRREGLPARVTGADLLISVAEAAAREGLGIYLLGGMPGVADQAAANLKARFPALRVGGSYCPPFGFEHDETESATIADRIRETGAELLFVGVGAPKQEKWAERWLDRTGARVALGVGAAFDFAAGTVSRAPGWMQRSGTEWMWRMAQEPGRLWRRYLLKDSYFLVLAMREIWRTGFRK